MRLRARASPVPGPDRPWDGSQPGSGMKSKGPMALIDAAPRRRSVSHPAHLATGSRPWPSTHAHRPVAPWPQMEKGPGASPEPFTMARASISRILARHVAMPGSAIYLGCRSRGTSISLPAGIGRAALIPPESGNPGLFGLSARGVYQAALLTHGTGGLLLWAPKRLSRAKAGPPFHPCPGLAAGRRFPFLRHFP